jgi:hypothetical protein
LVGTQRLSIGTPSLSLLLLLGKDFSTWRQGLFLEKHNGRLFQETSSTCGMTRKRKGEDIMMYSVERRRLGTIEGFFYFLDWGCSIKGKHGDIRL